MKNRSLISTLFAFLFATIGFCSHAISIVIGDYTLIAITAFIYVAPLWVESVEDMDSISGCDHVQCVIDRISVIIGFLYLLVILIVLVIQGKGLIVNLGSVGKAFFITLPVIFLIRKSYALRIKWIQNVNAERVYRPNTLVKMQSPSSSHTQNRVKEVS